MHLDFLFTMYSLKYEMNTPAFHQINPTVRPLKCPLNEKRPRGAERTAPRVSAIFEAEKHQHLCNAQCTMQ